MSIHKKSFEKIWVGSVSFTATEIFDDLNKAVAVSVPTAAAKIVIDDKTLGYDFKRIKEVKNQDANTLSTPGDKNPGGRESKKVSE
nr:hypothetical protein [uncultured Mediterranean phage uvMED]